jgi:hypothetical protein
MRAWCFKHIQIGPPPSPLPVNEDKNVSFDFSGIAFLAFLFLPVLEMDFAFHVKGDAHLIIPG